jgi:hypothetical protein
VTTLKDAGFVCSRRCFDTLIVWSCDRLARSTKHFLQVLDELDSCGVQFVSLREAFDTSGALGRAFLGIVAVLGEMERALLIERVRIAFVGRTLYALVFAGCPRFFENVPSGVVRINPDGTWEVVADLSAYFRSHPVQQAPLTAPDGDFESDGSPYSMISLSGDLYVAEANTTRFCE